MKKTHNIGELSPEMKIFELIEFDHSLLSIFSRLDIKLPFGDISVKEICHRDGYSPELFMILCHMHVDTDYRPAVSSLSADMLPQVIHYLRATHRYYTEYMLPHAALHLDSILEYCDKLSSSTLKRFYNDYTRCIEQHLEEEERSLFSLIDSNATECSTEEFNLDIPHSDIDDRTNDIASLIVKCLPEQAPTTLRCAMLKDIYNLRDDLRRHAMLESYLLRPLIDKFLKCDRQ